MGKWPCRWPQCTRWAQSNGFILCRNHYRTNQTFLELRQNGAEAHGENEVDGPPFFNDGTRRRRLPQQPLPVVANDEDGGEVRVHPLPGAEEVGAADDIQSDDIFTGTILVGLANAGDNVPTSSTPSHASSSPPSNSCASSTPITTTAVAVATTAARREGVDDSIHASGVQEHITQIYNRLNSLTQLLQSKEEKINDFQRRIVNLEQLMEGQPCTTYSLGGGSSGYTDSFPDGKIYDAEDRAAATDRPSVNDGNVTIQHKRSRGQNPHLDSAWQLPTKKMKTSAPITDINEGSLYYRKNFINSGRRTEEPDTVIDHARAGLNNCGVICYSNAIFQGLASCIHASQLFQGPPSDAHKKFPLYHAFASVMNAMVRGEETVVDPSPFVDLYRATHNFTDAQGNMFCDSQCMNEFCNVCSTNRLFILLMLRE